MSDSVEEEETVTIDAEENESLGEEDYTIEHGNAEYCANCKRKTNTHARDSLYNVTTRTYNRNQIRDRRNFRFIPYRKRIMCEENEYEYSLCPECAAYLTSDDHNCKNANTFKYVWPAFYWKLLNNRDILSITAHFGGAQRL